MRRHQDGYIWRKGGSWFGRWWEDVLMDGHIVRRQKARRLAPYCDRYRTEGDVRPLLEEVLRPLNDGKARPESTLSVAQFVQVTIYRLRKRIADLRLTPPTKHSGKAILRPA